MENDQIEGIWINIMKAIHKKRVLVALKLMDLNYFQQLFFLEFPFVNYKSDLGEWRWVAVSLDKGFNYVQKKIFLH